MIWLELEVIGIVIVEETGTDNQAGMVIDNMDEISTPELTAFLDVESIIQFCKILNDDQSWRKTTPIRSGSQACLQPEVQFKD